jgi:ferredoxin
VTQSQPSFPIAIEVSDECLGTAQCAMTAPELFALDDNDRSHPVRTINGAADLERAQIAVRSCPTQAIRIVPDE